MKYKVQGFGAISGLAPSRGGRSSSFSVSSVYSVVKAQSTTEYAENTEKTQMALSGSADLAHYDDRLNFAEKASKLLKLTGSAYVMNTGGFLAVYEHPTKAH